MLCTGLINRIRVQGFYSVFSVVSVVCLLLVASIASYNKLYMYSKWVKQTVDKRRIIGGLQSRLVLGQSVDVTPSQALTERKSSVCQYPKCKATCIKLVSFAVQFLYFTFMTQVGMNQQGWEVLQTG